MSNFHLLSVGMKVFLVDSDCWHGTCGVINYDGIPSTPSAKGRPTIRLF